MKLCSILLLAGTLQLAAKTTAQQITLEGQHVKLTEVIKAIKTQTGYVTVYDDQLLTEAPAADYHFRNAPLNRVLESVLSGLPYAFNIKGRTIFIRKLRPDPSIAQMPRAAAMIKPPQQRKVVIKIMDSTGLPLVGATIYTKSDGRYQQTNGKGEVVLVNPKDREQITASFVGYSSRTITLGSDNRISLILRISNNPLDEVQMIAYGTTTRRLNTGSVGHVSAAEIEKQPITNVLQALQGRVPGLLVTQSAGYGSAPFKVRIRGENSIAFASDPLFVVDGVPIMAGAGDVKNLGLDQSNLINGIGQSPIFSLNPSDIESIDVLKDADATAIYGSQGANGVILITTKKGHPGKTKFGINFYDGFGKVTRLSKLLNTKQYLAMRQEAFDNDGITPTVINAPDLMLWDKDRYTDWQHVLVGNTAHMMDVQTTVSGGDTYTRYRISGNYHKQTNVTTTSGADKRGSLSLSLNTQSKDRKFQLGFTGNYSHTTTDIISMDNSLMILPPNAPSIFDSNRNLNFNDWEGYSQGLFAGSGNPFSALLQPYSAETDNLQSNLNLQYKPMDGLVLRANGGYSSMQNAQMYLKPQISIKPNTGEKSSSNFGANSVKTWIIEPQAEYTHQWGAGRLIVLLGGTFQSSTTKTSNIHAGSFSNEALLKSLEAAKDITIHMDKYIPYRYQAIFARVNYNWEGKYLVNGTARRDGSSRFGPGNQFGNFGAVGAAWIFSEEPFIKKALSFLSFGKLRSSYGSTGSANIGDYKFISQWEGNDYPYDGTPTLSPVSHYNPDYGWEINKKLEVALELGFFKDNLRLTLSRFRNRSDNQLVSMPLPEYTGFSSVTANLPATVENTGWEFTISSTIIRKKDFNWNANLNVSIPSNKLVAFPNLSTSTYATKYEIGKPLTLQRKFHFLGIDSQTGAYQFEDVNNDGKISATGLSNDLRGLYNSSPVLFGGVNNSLTYKNWQLSLLIQFIKQKGFKYNYALGIPGSANNQPITILKHWSAPGDITDVPGLSTMLSTPFINYTNSDAGIVDASYARLQNLSLAYVISEKWLKKIHLQYMRIYLKGQNLLTLTSYDGADPETQSLTAIPPVRFMTAGIQITF